MHAYLLHVKDLDTMTNSFAADDHVVLVSSNFTPDGCDRVLGKTTKIFHLACCGDLNKGCSILLPDGNKLASSVRSPSPRGRTLSCTSQGSMGKEVVQIGLCKFS